MLNYFNKLGVLHFSCVSSQERTIQKSENINDVIAICTDIRTSNFPHMRSEYAMAYDQFNKKIIAYSGRTGFRSDFENVNETWAFDYSENKWTNITPDNIPYEFTEHFDMVYLNDQNVFIQYGGCCTDKTLELKIVRNNN